VTVIADPLHSDETKRISRAHLSRCLGDDAEKHLQIEGRRQHRVRPTPPRDEAQILIQQRHPLAESLAGRRHRQS
jgi:hypothetical protein